MNIKQRTEEKGSLNKSCPLLLMRRMLPNKAILTVVSWPLTAYSPISLQGNYREHFTTSGVPLVVSSGTPLIA